MNLPDKFDLFVLPEGVKKVELQKDTKIQNAALFTVQKEDHTVGNLIRMQLHRDPEVLFAGYRMPHPLEHKIVVKVQTTPNSEPKRAFNKALTELISELSMIEDKFKVLFYYSLHHSPFLPL
eukprot:TRINITY_DN296_c0_g1_i4.p1 TRINITY_DN296_c0_g1~~TRINITY_DN296_c0_g1_i4.p1  ORF type:complete len:122 (-),score=26.28 TRINITY_DN296_c0_g1_i4:190-555(-)